jgi:serine protease Do
MVGEGFYPKSSGGRAELKRSLRSRWLQTFVALGLILVAFAVEGRAQTPIRIGQTVEGTLEEGDRKMADGSYYDLYVFRGNRGQRIVVHLRSKDFRPYLSLMDENGVEILSDSGEQGHAHLRCTLAHAGRYFIRVNSVRRDGRGRYQLQLLEQ